jgi:hypothetical protein
MREGGKARNRAFFFRTRRFRFFALCFLRALFLALLSRAHKSEKRSVLLHFFRILFLSCRVIRTRNSYWAMGHCGVPNLFCRYHGFKTWVCRPPLVMLYTYTFKHHFPFKGHGKLLKTVLKFCAMVIDFALWPTAHNQMLRNGP